MAELAIRDDGEPTSITFGEAEPSHDGNKRFIAYLLAHVAHVPLVQFNDSFVERLAQQLMPNASAATKIRQLINPIIAVARSAKECGLIDFDIKLTRPKVPPQKSPNYLWPAEVERLLAHSPPHLETVIRFMLATAAGPQALKLKWENVRQRTGIVTFKRTKRAEVQEIQLPVGLWQDLQQLPHQTGRLFRKPIDAEGYVTSRGGARCIRSSFGRACRDAGLTAVTIGNVHATAMVWAFALDRDIDRFTQRCGIRDLRTVARYKNIDSNDLDRLAADLRARGWDRDLIGTLVSWKDA